MRDGAGLCWYFIRLVAACMLSLYDAAARPLALGHGTVLSACVFKENMCREKCLFDLLLYYIMYILCRVHTMVFLISSSYTRIIGFIS